VAYLLRQAISVVTDASGAFTGYTEDVSGFVEDIFYVPHASTPLDTGADVVFTEEATTKPILTKANIGTTAFSVAPRQATHSVTDGAALVYAPAGSPVEDKIGVVRSRIKLVVANGGNTKAGTFYIYLS